MTFGWGDLSVSAIWGSFGAPLGFLFGFVWGSFWGSFGVPLAFGVPFGPPDSRALRALVRRVTLPFLRPWAVWHAHAAAHGATLGCARIYNNVYTVPYCFDTEGAIYTYNIYMNSGVRN